MTKTKNVDLSKSTHRTVIAAAATGHDLTSVYIGTLRAAVDYATFAIREQRGILIAQSTKGLPRLLAELRARAMAEVESIDAQLAEVQQ